MRILTVRGVVAQERLGHHRTQTARSQEPSERRNEVNQQDNQVAHRAILTITVNTHLPQQRLGRVDREGVGS